MATSDKAIWVKQERSEGGQAPQLGQTVVWVNDDNVIHTVTSGAGAQPSHTPLSSSFLTRGQIFRHTFVEKGKYEYLCLPHLDQAAMRGATVTVAK